MEGCEIEFIPVGEGSAGGDSILIRYGEYEDRDNNQVVLIDGGTKESSEKLIKHIREFYKTEVIDLIISTHPDQDHASGLSRVFEEFAVLELWMHRPWEVASDLLDRFDDERVTANSLEARLRDGLNYAHDVEQLALKAGTPIKEPFQGLATPDSCIRVLGPSEAYYYNTIIPNLDFTPEPISTLKKVAEAAMSAAKTGVRWVKTFGQDLLTEPPGTSFSNNSSVITYFSFDGFDALFTADAGVPALDQAVEYAKTQGIDLKCLSRIQIPHHGSRRNIGPKTLNKLKAEQAYVSCPPDSDKHPSRRVLNAFKLRGMEVFRAKAGQTIRTGKNMSVRPNWITIDAVPFFDEVEVIDE